MLVRPTDRSVTVKAIAAQPVEVYFEYGPTSGGTSSTTTPVTYNTSVGGDYLVAAVIGGLTSDTRYKYRMRYRAAGDPNDFFAGAEYAFQTKRAKNSSFVFAVQSDSHMGYSAFHDAQVYAKTMQHIKEGGPDFVFDLGDFISLDDATEDATSVRNKNLNQRAFMEVPGKSAAIFLVLGNHENQEGWNLDDFPNRAETLPVLGVNGHKRYFGNPIPGDFYTGNLDASVTEIDGDHLRGDYYAFEWGNALFVAIDPYWYTTVKPYPGTTGGEKGDEKVTGNRWSWTLGKVQYDWLKSTLESSQAPLKFVFAHQPVSANDSDNYGRGGALAAVYAEMGGMNMDGVTSGWSANRLGWAAPIHKLFVDNHVTAFFHGHDHLYAQENKDGVVYQEVPMAAYHNANDDNMGFSGSYTGATLFSNSGHLRVTVGATGANVQYVRSSRNAGRDGLIQTSYSMPGCTADQDGDGTTNCYDKCPGDPGKIAPGQCGCNKADTDTDTDGTADCNDGCPNDKPKTAPGQCGCSTPDTDSDTDGTADCKDGCPQDVNKTAPGVCGCGVAETDSDGDGTPNCKDLCPNDNPKIAPGVCGCAVPDTDSDTDGTPDCKDGCPQDVNKTSPGLCGCGVPETPSCVDQCPADPNKTSPGQCGCGVADTDSDTDGTADCKDGCPLNGAKIAPGVCGCNVADTDSDTDGTADCKDGCPLDGAKIAPGVCGCNVADTNSDTDGTPDCKDGCPLDGQKVAPGVCGCNVADTDSDTDGTPDCKDGCPQDALKSLPGICGCGVADTDGDTDGVADCNDRCPNDRNKVAPGVCGCGVAEVDTDEDGTPDCQDQCPSDPKKSVPGVCGCGVEDVDANGNGTIDCQETNCQTGTCACNSVTLTADDSDRSAPVGTSIRFTATALCNGGAASYQFRLLRSTATWKPIRTWSADRILDWQTTGLAPGMYWIQAWARGASSPSIFDSSAKILFRLRKP